MKRDCFGLILILLSAAGVCSQVARADEVDRIASEVQDVKMVADGLGPQYLGRGELRGAQYVGERLIDGENFYRTKDYQRAAIIFMDIIENYPQHAVYLDALFLYADSLFLARDYLGSRVWFQRILDEGNRPGAARFRQKAIERLIEIAIHIDDFSGVEKYFAQLGKRPDSEARYVKGKYLYFRGEYSEARRVLEMVSGDPLLTLKATYLIGVSLTRQERYKEAIDVFLEGRQVQPQDSVQQEIVDLLNLGAGRLYFEQGFVAHASECYQAIRENSPYFDAALYEAASVLIRTGDTIRAEQTLEVLTVAVPDSKYIPRAKMLRGNLLLRTGRYNDAERVFNELVEEYTPVMEQLEQLIDEKADTSRFFSDLVSRSLSTLDVGGVLPPLVVKWVGEEREVQRAIEVAYDLGVAGEYVKETERLIRLLEAVIDGPSRINAIPLLREAMRRSQQLVNRLGRARCDLLELAEREFGESNAQVQQLKRQRLDLEREIAALPISDEDFDERETRSRQVYVRMRKELARNEIRLDQVTAMAVAIERFIEDPAYVEGVPQDSIDALKAELERHRVAAEGLRTNLAQLKLDVESARYQVGVGDTADQQDEEIRLELRNLSQQERAVLRASGGRLGQRMDAVYASIDSLETMIGRFQREVADEARRQVDNMKNLVESERDHVYQYRAELGALGDEAEEVVGGVAYENFSSVRKRFHELILKADVGIIDVAWLRKEEHTARITELTKSRLSDIKVLDGEYQEVKSSETESEK